jgi:hypothetical protein
LEHFLEMKKQQQKSRQRRRKLNATQFKRQVLGLTAQGKNRAVVAATLGIGAPSDGDGGATIRR